MLQCAGSGNFIITLSDVWWIYKHLHRSGRFIVQHLLHKKYPDRLLDSFTDSELVNAARSIVEQCRSSLDATSDIVLLDMFFDVSDTITVDVLRAFKVLWRGYVTADMDRQIELVQSELASYSSTITEYMGRASILLGQASSNSQQARTLKTTESELKRLREVLQGYMVNVRTVSKARLLHDIRRRRSPNRTLPDWCDAPYDGLEYKLSRLNPDLLGFPLRFMVSQPAGVYHRLEELWLSGQRDRRTLLNALDGVASHSSNGISGWELARRLMQEFDDHMDSSFSRPFSEARAAFDSAAYFPSALALCSITEGSLWQFAERMNQRRKLVFRASRKNGQEVRKPYLWDRESRRYTRKKGSRCWALGPNLLSAKALLTQTRIGEIISDELYGYFIDDFYIDRCALAHGHLANRDYVTDCGFALMCLVECLVAILEYGKKHRFF